MSAADTTQLGTADTRSQWTWDYPELVIRGGSATLNTTHTQKKDQGWGFNFLSWVSSSKIKNTNMKLSFCFKRKKRRISTHRMSSKKMASILYPKDCWAQCYGFGSAFNGLLDPDPYPENGSIPGKRIHILKKLELFKFPAEKKTGYGTVFRYEAESGSVYDE